MAAFDVERSETIITPHRSPLRAVAIAVAVGASFGAGALAGKTGHAARPPEAPSLALADKRADELAQRRLELKLGFASELTKPDAPTRPPPIPKLKPEKKPDGASAAKAAPAAVSERAAIPLAAPPEPEREQEKEPERAPDKEAPARASDDDDDEDGTPRRSDPARVKEALAKVLGTATTKAEPEKSEDRPSRRYTLQVASTPVKDNAEQLAKKLTAEGHAARVVEAEVDGGKKVYRVRVGSFDSREDADTLKTKLAMPTFVVGE